MSESEDEPSISIIQSLRDLPDSIIEDIGVQANKRLEFLENQINILSKNNRR